MLDIIDIVLVDTHKLRQGQSRGKLGKFGWLQAQRPQYEPRARAFDTMRIKDGTKQQQQHNAKDDKGKHVEIAIVEQQNHEAYHDRGGYPYNLHA